jgi:protein-disulfide isomerase
MYVTGGAAALAIVGALILLGAVSRGDNESSNSGTVFVPTPRPATVARAGQVFGDPAAPVTIVEYIDYQCPVCRRAGEQIMPPIEQEFIATGKARLEMRPIAILGDESSYAAQSAQCAEEQGKFWEFHDLLFANQAGENKGAFSRDNMKRFASALGLDTTAFNSCLDSGKYANQVTQDTSNSKNSGVKGTPTIFVNGVKVDNSLEAVRAAITSAPNGGS